MENYFQEIPFNVLEKNPYLINELNNRLLPLLPELDSIDAPLRNLSDQVSRSSFRNQVAMSTEIHQMVHNMVKPNEGLLHSAIEKDKTLKRQYNEIVMNKSDPSQNKERLQQIATEIKAMTDNIITDVDHVDFEAISKIIERRIEEEVLPSFKKVWTWTLEVYFGTAVSKYYWPEFSEKVLKKNKGAELKRRIIVHNYCGLNNSEIQELLEIDALHSRLLRDKLKNNDLNAYLDVLKHISAYVNLYQTYRKIKKEGTDANEVKKLREEDLNFIGNSKKLNDQKYEVMNEMQNLLLYIDSSLG